MFSVSDFPVPVFLQSQGVFPPFRFGMGGVRGPNVDEDRGAGRASVGSEVDTRFGDGQRQRINLSVNKKIGRLQRFVAGEFVSVVVQVDFCVRSEKIKELYRASSGAEEGGRAVFF